MRDKLLQIRVDDDFLSKLEYLQKINGFKFIAETVRKIVEKEYRKENDSGGIMMNESKWIRDGHHITCDKCGTTMCDTDREGDKIPTNFCPNCGEKMTDEDE